MSHLHPSAYPNSRITRGPATRLGLVAILFWSTTIAFSRSLAEQLGTLTSAAAIHLVGGFIGCIFLLCKKDAVQRVFQLPRNYLVVCGALFGIYGVSLYLAIGLSASRQQVIEVGIINYLWPGLTIVFSLPVLKQRAKFLLLPGILVSFVGAVLVMAPQGGSLFEGGFGIGSVSKWPYLFAMIAAVSWGLYSNFARRFASGVDTNGAVPVFLLMTGIALSLLRLGVHEETQMTLKAFSELAYLGFVPTFLAYVFWDISVRCGDLNLVAALSYLIPLLSTLASCLYLGILPGFNIFLGCFLVICGALMSRKSIVNRHTVPAIQ